MPSAEESSLQIPDGFDIFSARYERDGDDLVIAGDGSPPLTVVDYFALSTPPALVAPNGALLTGDVVELLAGPRAPGQYAQADTQADAPEGATPIGQVETLSGTSTATRVSGETVELGRGDPVFQGDVLETASDSTLGVRLEDGTLASMSAASRLVLNEFVYETGGSDNWMLVNLVEGAFAFLTGAVAPSGGMEITTPVAVMAIRGTMPIAFVAGAEEGGATQFFAGSDKDYELLHATTREVLTIVSSEAGFSLSAPDAPLETIDLGPDTLDEINNLLDVLNDTAASLGFLGIEHGSGFAEYSAFGSIDGDNLAALLQFLLLLEASLTEENVIEVADSQQFLQAQDAELIASPDAAATAEMAPVPVSVLDNDSNPAGAGLSIIFADVPNGQGTVTITDDQQLLYDPGDAFRFLALGETADVEITYTIANASGAVSSTTATVTLTGINQAPVIISVAESNLVEQTDTQALHTTITVSFTDVDLNNVGHAAAVTGVEVTGYVSGLMLDEAALVALLSPGPVSKDMGQGNGSVDLDFSAGSTVFDYLPAGESVRLTYTVEIDDQDGGAATQELDVVVTGTNDAPIIEVEVSDVSEAVVEHGFDANGNPIGEPNASGQIEAFDVDNGGETYSFTPPQGTYGTFAISATGAWTYTLDDAATDPLALGQSDTDQFVVTVTDGFGATAEVVVTLTVTGANDTPVVSNVALGAVEDGPAVTGSFIGADIDSDDDAESLVYSVVAQPDEGTVTNNGDGTFSFDPGNDFQDLAAGESRQVTFTYAATDGHGAQSEPATTTVTVTGTNDRPTLSIVDTAGEMTEGDGAATLSDSGALSFADLDATDTVTISHTYNGDIAWSGGTLDPGVADALVAGFSVNQAGWVYSASENMDFLGEGQTITLSFDVVATDDSGTGNAASAAETVTVTIHGTGDGPVIGGVATGAVSEDTDVDADQLTTGGVLTIADVDAGESSFQPQAGTAGSNGYGTFTLLADGTWSYTADNTQAAIQELGAGDTLTDSFTAVSFDGTATETVTVTIHGTNDDPVISIAAGDSAAGAFSEIAARTGSTHQHALDGTLTFTDMDVADNGHGVETTSVEATGDSAGLALSEGDLSGLFSASINQATGADGTVGQIGWSFAAEDGVFDYLEAGQTLVLTYTVTVSDEHGGSSSEDVVITVHGATEGPILDFEVSEFSGGNSSFRIFDVGMLKDESIHLLLTSTEDDQVINSRTDDVGIGTASRTIDAGEGIRAEVVTNAAANNPPSYAGHLMALAFAATMATVHGEPATAFVRAVKADDDNSFNTDADPDDIVTDIALIRVTNEANNTSYEITDFEMSSDGEYVVVRGLETGDTLTVIGAEPFNRVEIVNGANERDANEALFGGGDFLLTDIGFDLEQIVTGTDPDSDIGTDGADHLVGTEGDDVLVGLGGMDTLEGNGGDDVFVLTDLSIHDVIVDYDAGDVIDLTRLGFELATGQLNPSAADEFVRYDQATGELTVDDDGADGAADFVLAAQVLTAPQSVVVRLWDGDNTGDVVIA